MKDLVVVAACGAIEQAIHGLLTRHQSLGIRCVPPDRVTYIKEGHADPGTYKRGPELAAFFRNTHQHALVVLDPAWEGCPTDDPAALEASIEQRLAPHWGPRGRCVVIQPEVEVWIWSDSPHVAAELGWDTAPKLRTWLHERGLWTATDSKPADPKEAYLRAIREKRIQRSNATFHNLAQKVGLERCKDPAFRRLRDILAAWFPPVP